MPVAGIKLEIKINLQKVIFVWDKQLIIPDYYATGIYFPKFITYGRYRNEEAYVMESVLKNLEIVFDMHRLKAGLFIPLKIVRILLLFMVRMMA